MELSEPGKTLHELTDDEIRAFSWYYQVELRPGVHTQGRLHFTAAMVRALLERTDLEGTRCLDVGTQEALTAVSLERLGAEKVVAYDRLDLTARIDLVREAYGVEFEYWRGLQLNELPGRLADAGHGPFDVVVFAGVLYHMIDPLAGLGTVRGFVREQGLVIVETAAIVSDEMVLYFNAAAQLYPSSSYFMPSLSWLDYCLRMLRLKPIDCLYFAKGEDGTVGRVAVVCRAVDRPVAFPDDTWMGQHWVEMDFRAASLDYDRLASDAPEVPYAPGREALLFHEETGSVDIYRTVMQSRPWKRDPEKARLQLSDYREDVSDETTS